MGKKLLIVNTYANLWSTGRIAAEIGEIAVKRYIVYYTYLFVFPYSQFERIRFLD